MEKIKKLRKICMALAGAAALLLIACIVLGGMFLFSGNIIVPIAIHTIHDILAIGVQSAVTEEGVVTASVTVQTLIEDAALVLLFAFVIYFIFNRKNKEAIHSVWDKKWKIDSDKTDFA